MPTIRDLDLFDIIPERCFKHEEYCEDFVHWENKVATPELLKKGWYVLGWHTGEKDSFGPLSRYARVELNGRSFKLHYG